MSDAIALAHSVIAKYGADADIESVHLARAVIDVTRERNQLLAQAVERVAEYLSSLDGLKQQLATVTAERDAMKQAVAEQLRYDMASVLSDTPENRVAQQLAAMTAARDEACDWLDKFVRHRNSPAENAMLAELRKVGK